MKPISFKHQYYKLSHPEFTTIRGKAQFKRLKVGQVVPVETPDRSFYAVVTKLELAKVHDLPVAFLKADAEYPGFEFGTRSEFCDLLNSFRAPAWTQVTLDSELTVITLRKETK